MPAPLHILKTPQAALSTSKESKHPLKNGKLYHTTRSHMTTESCATVLVTEGKSDHHKLCYVQRRMRRLQGGHSQAQAMRKAGFHGFLSRCRKVLRYVARAPVQRNCPPHCNYEVKQTE